ncbi:MAG: hypothetical protein EPO52_10845 [Herbiconiux sp.]|uniref:hypothetical protein n=1 Tax=Herbiconiux sp. TaxID=1871186 RepID=UPI0012096E52|nr:hypothetical protein [Herbiconiux sp.]TAJ48603.1 MAG: hypothetical protein EPO52_10845 [Herbiconiux sp.]
MTQDVETVASELDCASYYPLMDDIYGATEMRGEICVTTSGDFVNVRAFPPGTNLSVVLENWVIGGDIYLVTGSEWFVVGPRDQVESVHEVVVDSSPPTSEKPPPAAETTENARVTDCMQLVSSAVAMSITDRDIFDESLPQLEYTAPGFSELIERPSIRDVTEKLVGVDPSSPGFASQLSVIGPDVREFCRSAGG